MITIYNHRPFITITHTISELIWERKFISDQNAGSRELLNELGSLHRVNRSNVLSVPFVNGLMTKYLNFFFNKKRLKYSRSNKHLVINKHICFGTAKNKLFQMIKSSQLVPEITGNWSNIMKNGFPAIARKLNEML